MERIYFDSQIFRYLKDGEKYAEYFNKIYQSKKSCLFLYSQAHINDLKRDKSEKKYTDLEFMGQLVDDNFLFINPLERNCNIVNASPCDVFDKETVSEENTSIPIQDFDLSIIKVLKDLPMMKDYSIIFESLETLNSINETIDTNKTVSIPEFDSELTDDMHHLLESLGVEQKEYSWEEWKDLSNSMGEVFQNNDSIYRLNRKLLKEYIGVDEFKISISEGDFNEKLKQSKLGQTFINLVDSMTDLIKIIPLFDNFFMRYFFSYMILNILGVDNEKNKKSKFKNTENDAHHSYYGMFADYVVSDDIPFLNKTKFLYNFYGIKTKVLTFSEYITEFAFLDPEIINLGSFFEMLKFYIKNSLLIAQAENLLKEPAYKFILQYKMFSYFNQMEIHEYNNKTVFCFYKHRQNVSDFISFKEIKSVVNQLFNLLDIDNNFKAEFQKEEIPQFNDEWGGRTWTHDNSEYQLRYIKEQNKFIFVIELIKNS